MFASNPPLDMEEATRFITAAYALWRYDGFRVPPSSEIRVIFSASARRPGSPDEDYSDLARQTGLDVVMFEFEPGAEALGPWNVAVCLRWSGELRSFPQCAFWENPDGRVMTLMPEDETFCIAFDGSALRYAPFLPAEDLAQGFASARVRLLAAVRRVHH